MANKTTYRLLKLIAEMSNNNYPEFLSAMIIVNAPMLFTGIYKSYYKLRLRMTKTP